MIVPMKKVSLVVLEKERKLALKKLRKIGVVHLEDIVGASVELTDLKGKFSKLETASILLSEIKPPKGKEIKCVELTAEQALLKSDELLGYFSAKKNFDEEIAKNFRELERLQKWGTIKPEDFTYLEQKNIFLSLYEIPSAKYSSIPEDVHTILVNMDKNQTRFLLLSQDGKRPESMPADAFSVSMPEKSTLQLADEISRYKQEIDSIQDDILASKAYLKSIQAAMKHFEQEVYFETVYSGMAKDEDGNQNALAWVSGYVPSESLSDLQKLASTEKWALLALDPTDDDPVPTLLKNNKLVSLIYPVSDFLGTVPGYTEYDISGWFLLFFSIFFGMIFGDGGYGFLMVIIALYAVVSSLAKKQEVAPAMYLLLLLGATTMLWGSITCTWFGLSPDVLPAFLVNISFAPLSSAVSAQSAEKANWVTQNMQIFCFTLGLIQLSVAHIKGIIKNRSSLKFLGELGSLMMVCGMYYVVLNMVVDKTRFPYDHLIFGIPAGSIFLPCLGIGFFFNFTFSNYDGNILKSMLESLKNIVSVILGVVNVFGDIVSYIRLWAVGLAGGAISATINAMAGPTLGGALIFLGIILLFFVHGLNMVLNVLSVIVHGVRLNTLEFSGHLGMSWSGFSYKPFSENT